MSEKVRMKFCGQSVPSLVLLLGNESAIPDTNGEIEVEPYQCGPLLEMGWIPVIEEISA